eukprot:846743-Karenia_brevis.AAC.1
MIRNGATSPGLAICLEHVFNLCLIEEQASLVKANMNFPGMNYSSMLATEDQVTSRNILFAKA